MTFKVFGAREIGSGKVGQDPLVVYNGKPLGNYSGLDLSKPEFNSTIGDNWSFPQGSKTLVEIFGSDAKDGILSLEDKSPLYCRRPPPKLIVVNDKVIAMPDFINNPPKKIKRFAIVNWVQREQDSTYLYSSIWYIEAK